MKIVKEYLNIFLLVLIITHIGRVSQANVFFQDQYFGVSFRFESKDLINVNGFKLKMDRLVQRLKVVLDPDCLWRAKKDKLCEFHKEYEAEKQALDHLSNIIYQETNGFFSVAIKGHKKDYSGLSQGYFIEQVKKTVREPWLIDFSGDIYLSKDMKPDKSLGIRDPLNSFLRYASVHMKSGWMIGAGGPSLGVKLLDPSTGRPPVKNDFNFIVIFAKPEMNGARVDAWATAIMVGGERVLKYIQSLTKYKGEWGYLLFTKNGAIKTSENIIIREPNSKNPQERWVIIPW